MAGREYALSVACQKLHEAVWKLPRFRAGFNPNEFPANGIYVLFEVGEHGHGGERIVRIGTHRGPDNLGKRIREHVYTRNKDRSIFRKHIGRALLQRRNDVFLEQWDVDLTTKQAREQHEDVIDKATLARVEDEVSAFMNGNFSFCVLRIDQRPTRLLLEQQLLSVVSQCESCGPSEQWLGKHHPNPVIRESGLWNIQGLNGAILATAADIRRLFLD